MLILFLNKVNADLIHVELITGTLRKKNPWNQIFNIPNHLLKIKNNVTEFLLNYADTEQIIMINAQNISAFVHATANADPVNYYDTATVC